jgi:hypothetical protein
MALSPVQELCEAARLMRDRAQAASDAPWQVTEAPDMTPSYVIHTSYVIHKGEDYITGVCLSADAEHIAHMHPLVALAVAGWLEESAGWFDRTAYRLVPEGTSSETPPTGGGHDSIWYHQDCDGAVDTEDCLCFTKALAVARAYLGSGPHA